MSAFIYLIEFYNNNNRIIPYENFLEIKRSIKEKSDNGKNEPINPSSQLTLLSSCKVCKRKSENFSLFRFSSINNLFIATREEVEGTTRHVFYKEIFKT